MEGGTPKQGFADGAGAKCAVFKEKMYTKTQSDGQDIPSNTLPCKVAWNQADDQWEYISMSGSVSYR